jgi:hypothetical protein
MATAPLRVQSVSRGPVCFVRITGVVDESFNPDSILSQLNGNKVILNLRGLSRLTSFGVREWTSTMRELSGRMERVYWVECSPAVVTQLGMVANFAGAAEILSVQAPFHCDQCGHEQEVTINMSAEQIELPTVPCEKCGTQMEFDDDPDSYFAIPRPTKGGPVTESLDGVLRHFAQSVPEHEGTGVRSTLDNDPSVLKALGDPKPVTTTTTGSSTLVSVPSSPPQSGSQITPIAKSLVLGLLLSTVVGLIVVLSLRVWEQHRSESVEELLSSCQVSRAHQLIRSQNSFEQERKLADAAANCFEEALMGQHFPEAEAIVAEFEPEGSLAPDARRWLTEEIARIRERVSASFHDRATRAFASKDWEKVLDAVHAAMNTAPLDPEITFQAAEAARQLKRADEAAEHYEHFIQMVAPDNPNDPRLGDALCNRGLWLADKGMATQAKEIAARLSANEKPDLKSCAARILAPASGGGSPTPPPDPR